MDSERASRHWTDAIETELCGRGVLLCVQSQHVPCELSSTTRAWARIEVFFVMTSKHVVYELVFPCKSISACTSTVQCSAREFALNFVLLLMAEEFSATAKRQGAASIHRARPSQWCLVGSSRLHMQKSRVERAATRQGRSQRWRSVGLVMLTMPSRVRGHNEGN
jgi:hypothetical protein